MLQQTPSDDISLLHSIDERLARARILCEGPDAEFGGGDGEIIRV